MSSFVVMAIAGMSLEYCTLMALSLSIGLLIDDAIVSSGRTSYGRLEHGEVPLSRPRAKRHDALRSSQRRVHHRCIRPSRPFHGRHHRTVLCRDFGIAVALAVLVSLFVSFTLDPCSPRRGASRCGANGKTAPHARALNASFDRTAPTVRACHRLVPRPPKDGYEMPSWHFLPGLVVFGLLESEFMPDYDRAEFKK